MQRPHWFLLFSKLLRFWQQTKYLVLWLSEETRNQKVVSSNPGAGYWMDIIHIYLL